MGVRMLDVVMRGRAELRYEPLDRRIRAVLGGEVVVDSTRAVLVWEPGRVVPSYAVPASDISGMQIHDADDAPPVTPDLGQRRTLDPRVPFAIHTTPGRSATITSGGHTAAAFRPSDADLVGYAELDFTGFERWQEEDELVVAHPRDPYHRIDVLASSRSLRLELEGTVVAATDRARWLFETALPTRYYLPREDVLVPVRPSTTRTYCAYKGEASYLSVEVGDRVVDDLVWEYAAPLNDAVPVRGLVAFFHERLDLFVDGEAVPRQVTPWSHAG
jgi:uncharacterized protein (DUF427 family)